MRRGLLLLSVLILLSACGEKDGTTPAVGTSAADASLPLLAEVKVEPAFPTVADLVRALPRFKENTGKPVPLEYRWYVNGDLVEKEASAVLAQGVYKRGDRLQCRARSGRGDWMQSETVEVENASPRFRAKPVTPFDIPGEFFHQVFADDPDGDSVTYRLVSPLARGVELDPRTGIIRWRIESIPEAPPPPARSATPAREGTGTAGALPRNPTAMPEKEDPFTLRILIEADDGHGGIARHMLVLDLRRGMEQVQVD